MSRRKFLALSLTVGVSGALAACGTAPEATTPGATTPPDEAAVPTQAPAEVTPAGGAPAETATAADAAAAAQPTSDAPPPPSTAENVIDWWYGWGGTGGKALEQAAQAFNEENRGFTVLGTSVPGIAEKLLTSIAGNVPPSVHTGNIPYAEFYSRGGFEPLDELIDSSQNFKRDQIIDPYWHYTRWNGKTYGIPSVEGFASHGLVVNADLATKAGLDPNKLPETWDEAFEWHEKMTELDNVGNVKVVGFDPLDGMGGWLGSAVPFLWGISYGFDYFDENAKTYNFDNPLFVEAMSFIKRIYDHVGAEKMTAFRKTNGTWTSDPTASFPVGAQGMILNGYWTPGELAKTAPDKNFAYGWVPVSTERRGTKFQATGSHNTGIPKGATKTDKAWQFIEYIASDKAIDIIFKGTGWLGASKSYIDKIDASQYKGLEWYVGSLKEATEIRGMDLDPIEGFTGTQWAEGIQKVTFGQLTPEDFAKQLQDTVTRELKDRDLSS